MFSLLVLNFRAVLYSWRQKHTQVSWVPLHDCFSSVVSIISVILPILNKQKNLLGGFSAKVPWQGTLTREGVLYQGANTNTVVWKPQVQMLVYYQSINLSTYSDRYCRYSWKTPKWCLHCESRSWLYVHVKTGALFPYISCLGEWEKDCRTLKLAIGRLWHPKGTEGEKSYFKAPRVFPRVSVVGLSWLAEVF